MLVSYYISRRKETAPMLYLLLTLTDLIVGTSAAGNYGNSYIIVSNSVVTKLVRNYGNSYIIVSNSVVTKFSTLLW